MSNLGGFKAGRDIAIVGISCSFPGAKGTDQFWANLCEGRESVSFYTDTQLAAAGISDDLLRHPNYVKAGFSLAGPDLFDAEFFGYTPLEARFMDPQHRWFLEHSYAALENAGCDPSRYKGRIGVFGGEGSESAYTANLTSNFAHGAAIGDENPGLGYEGFTFTTRVSYKLNLRGPSVPVQTACSTGLVAVHLACRSLLDGECEMAIAGAAAFKNYVPGGYFAPPESVLSSDGHVHPFDDAAYGTVFGSGVGVLALKRLDDALVEKDTIYAVIKGSAINNDGAGKVSFVSPAVDGQTEVVIAALQAAGVSARSIGYVEAHGTGTQVGDRIEIAALTRAFRRHTEENGFCRIGSAKSNIGHMDAAAGMAGIIKVIMALRNRMLPPTINVSVPNRAIDFDASPFLLQQTLEPWPEPEGVRLAGVSAFGFGGTNAHVIVAEPPERPSPDASRRRSQLVLVSARTAEALEESTAQLAGYAAALPAGATAELADAAFTLATGRQHLKHRRIVVADDPATVASLLRSNPGQLPTSMLSESSGEVAFLLSGQGSQYPGMAAELYAGEPVFRAAVASCAEECSRALGFDVAAAIFTPPEPARAAEVSALLAQTHITQPALFMVEYAMAKLLESWGITPAALIGHSIGEMVAACLAGVFSVSDALDLVVIRGRLMQAQEPGAMVSVTAEREWLESLLPESLCVAAHNGPQACVVAGPAREVADFTETLRAQGVLARPVATSRAFHSAMMEPMVDDFIASVADRNRNVPEIPFISNVTGTWISDKEAQDPRYWGRHIRACVEFAAGLRTLATQPTLSMIEVGPGQTLAGLARRNLGSSDPRLVSHTLPHKDDPRAAMATLQRCLGQLWMAGAEPDWDEYYRGQERRKVALPGYPFQRRRHWLEVSPASTINADTGVADSRPHPLIDELVLASMGESTFRTRLDPKRHWILAEHKLLGEPAVPGSAFVEIARAAAQIHLGQTVTELSVVDFLVPLVVQEGNSRLLHTRIWDVGPDIVEFRMVSFDPGRPDGQQWTEHARGRASAGIVPSGPRYDITAERSARGAAAVELPNATASDTMSFGPRWQGMLTSVGERLERTFAQLDMPAEFSAEVREYGLHPALLDLAASSYEIALSAGAATSGAASRHGIFLPIGYDRIRIHRPLPANVICLACPSPGYEQGDQVTKVDIVICDDAGEVAAEISGFTVELAVDLATTLEEARGHGRHHVIRWREVPPPRDLLTGQAALVLSDGSSAAGRALAAELRAAGCTVTEAVVGPSRLARADNGQYEIPASLAGFEDFFAGLPDRTIDITAYVAPERHYPVGDDSENAKQYSDDAALRLFEFVKALATADISVTQLCVVASNVDRISGAEKHSAPWLAALFGVAKAIGHEVSGLWGRTIDIDAATDMKLVAQQILAKGGAGAVGLREGHCFVPELVSHVTTTSSTPSRGGRKVTNSLSGACLITGGTGGLGLALARHLAVAQRGVPLALVGRTVLPRAEQWSHLTADGTSAGHTLTALRELEELGARVRYYAADVGRADEVADLIEAVHADFGRIGLIVHSAGIPGDGFVVRKDTATFASNLSPKTAGAWYLDAFTVNEAPEMVLFASTVGLFGGVGQSDYTAGNSFLDSFADYRSALGRRTVTVDWSDWLDTGMAAGQQPDTGFFLSLSPSASLVSFDEIRAGRETRVVVGQVNMPYLSSISEQGWSWWLHNSPVRLPAELTLAVGKERERAAARGRPAEPAAATIDQQVKPTGRSDGLYSETESQVAQIWGRELDLSELNVFENSFDLGGNSLMALRIAQNIERRLGVRVRMADLFRHATVADLAAHIDMLRDE